jgi:transcription elongation factor Elf1
MKCDKCGAQMNRHAEKLVFPGDGVKPGPDPVLGGVIEETFGCPVCGNVQARRP